MDTFRIHYAPLTEEQQAEVNECKEMAQKLLNLLNIVVPEGERSERARCVALAKTKLEEAVMWAVKGFTA